MSGALVAAARVAAAGLVGLAYAGFVRAPVPLRRWLWLGAVCSLLRIPAVVLEATTGSMPVERVSGGTLDLAQAAFLGLFGLGAARFTRTAAWKALGFVCMVWLGLRAALLWFLSGWL